MSGYKPQDRLFLWFLGQPDRPRLVGDLEAVRTSRGVSLRYDDAWLRDGFALSEDLPLLPQVFLPPQRDTAAGAVDVDNTDDHEKNHVLLADSTLDNAMSMSTLFSLKADDAAVEVRSVCKVVEGWKHHFRRCKVTAHDIELLAEQIDRPFLRDQRTAF